MVMVLPEAYEVPVASAAVFHPSAASPNLVSPDWLRTVAGEPLA
jgi:hypothetical protein